MVLKFFVGVFLFSIIIINANLASAQSLVDDAELKRLGFTGYETTNTDSPNYIFKRILEELKLKFVYRDKTSQARYMSKLLDARFKEVVYVANNKQIGIFENTISRYNTLAGKIISSYKDIDPEADKQIENYVKILERMRDIYPANSSYWLLVQYTIDTTKRLN